MKPPNVDLHIDRLVLHGFDHVDHVQLGAAVEAELTRLFTEQGAAASLRRGGTVARLDGGALTLSSNAGADAIGAQIAQVLYTGLNR